MQNKTIYEILKKIVSENDIYDQETIVEMLDKHHGINITQSSLSRKISKIGIIKINGKYSIIQNPLINGVEIKIAPPNIVLIKTTAGFASAVAFNIDTLVTNRSEKVKGIVGTVAGDDTVIVIIDSTLTIRLGP